MGSCAPSLEAKLYNKDKPSLKYLPGRILKCPNGNGHWLALYDTPTCSKCPVASAQKKAHVNCVRCVYSLCEDCYNAKALELHKYSDRVSPEIIKNYILEVKTQLHESLRRKTQKQVKDYNIRFTNFMKAQKQKNTNNPEEESQNYYINELESKVKKLIQKCEIMYNIRPQTEQRLSL